MDNISLCASALFQSHVTKSLLLARDNPPKEAGFNCWIDEEGGLVINEPALGEDYSIPDYNQLDKIYAPFSGFRQGRGSQTVLHVHTHPQLDLGKGEIEGWLLAPSIQDITFLLGVARQNRAIAEFFGRTFWINPIAVIISPGATRWGLVQINPTAAYHVNFDPGELWARAIWKMFQRYYPHHAKKGTGPIAEIFGPDRTYFGIVLGDLLGRFMEVPRFLSVSTKRYREFMETAGVTWLLVDPSNFPTSLNFSYKIEELCESEDDEDEEGEGGFGLNLLWYDESD